MRGHHRGLVLAAAAAGLFTTLSIGAAETIDYDAIAKIKAEGMQPQRSRVMETASWLTDVYGPRLTGSPNIQKAAEWAIEALRKWQLANVALEKWPTQNGFEHGWA